MSVIIGGMLKTAKARVQRCFETYFAFCLELGELVALGSLGVELEWAYNNRASGIFGL